MITPQRSSGSVSSSISSAEGSVSFSPWPDCSTNYDFVGVFFEDLLAPERVEQGSWLSALARPTDCWQYERPGLERPDEAISTTNPPPTLSSHPEYARSKSPPACPTRAGTNASPPREYPAAAMMTVWRRSGLRVDQSAAAAYCCSGNTSRAHGHIAAMGLTSTRMPCSSPGHWRAMGNGFVHPADFQIKIAADRLFRLSERAINDHLPLFPG